MGLMPALLVVGLAVVGGTVGAVHGYKSSAEKSLQGFFRPPMSLHSVVAEVAICSSLGGSVGAVLGAIVALIVST